MDAILQIPIKIIKEQELIIGPLAWYEAGKVAGLTIDPSHTSVSFNGDAKDIINRLITQYERIFGRASHEVCREAVRDIISGMSSEEVPSSLK
jgi:hypothetical protein